MASKTGESSDPIDGLSLSDLPRRMVAPCSALLSLLVVLRKLSLALSDSASVLPSFVSGFRDTVESLHSHTASSIQQLLATRTLLRIACDIEALLRSSSTSSSDVLTSTGINQREDETSLLGFNQIVASSASSSFRAHLECVHSNCLPYFFHTTPRSIPSNRPHDYEQELELLEMEKLARALKTSEEVCSQFLKLASEMNAELVATVGMLKSVLVSNRSQPSFVTRAILQKQLHSYLHSDDTNINEDCEEEKCWLSEMENELLKKMQNPEGPLIIWIAGVEGIGKTSLASLIAGHSQILRSFPGGVYWVSLGQRTNLIKAQSMLWSEITGSKTVFTSVEDGTAALMKQFSEALPSLLVLDDVCDEMHLRAFLCFEGRGIGRILATSSSSSLDGAFGKLEVHRCILHHLDEASGMQMFRSVAMWQGDVDMVRQASVIARGQPWLIQAIASIYYKRRVAHLPPPCEESAENTSGLSLCFDSLQELHPQLQGCFLDLVAFPKGEWVDSETLIDMWVLGDGTISKEEAHLILSLLAIRGTLEWKLESRLDHDGASANKAYYDNGWIGYALQVKLLDQFYDFAKLIMSWNISSHYCYTLGAARAFAPRANSQEAVDGERENGLVTKLSVVGSQMVEIPELGNFPSLRVALLSDNGKLKCVPQAILAGATVNLTMLKLSNCSTLMWLPDSIGSLRSLLLLDLSLCVHLSSLPSTIGKLVNLRFLHLSGCISLQILPKSITRLYRLERFDLSLCSSVKRLPSLLGRLVSLRHLNLCGCDSLQALPSSMSALLRLKFLNISYCSNLSYTPPFLLQASILLQGGGCTAMAVPMDLWKLGRLESLHLCALKKLSYLPGIATKLKHLRHLSMARCRSLEYLPDNLGALSLIESLDLAYTAIRKLPHSIGQLKSLVTLRLRGCSRLLVIPPSISCLLKLERLDAGECWDLTVIPDSFGLSGSLSELRELDLSGSALKDLPCLTIGAMPKLMKLNLSGCRNLQTLPPSFGLLGSLQTLNLEGCQSLPSLNNASISQLQKLRWLNLRNCTTLKTLPVSELEAMIALQFLDVSGCSGLTPFPNSLLECAKNRLFTLVRWGAVWY